MSITRTSLGDAQRPSCSAKMRREGLRRISPSCRRLSAVNYVFWSLRREAARPDSLFPVGAAKLLSNLRWGTGCSHSRAGAQEIPRTHGRPRPRRRPWRWCFTRFLAPAHKTATYRPTGRWPSQELALQLQPLLAWLAAPSLPQTLLSYFRALPLLPAHQTPRRTSKVAAFGSEASEARSPKKVTPVSLFQ